MTLGIFRRDISGSSSAPLLSKRLWHECSASHLAPTRIGYRCCHRRPCYVWWSYVLSVLEARRATGSRAGQDRLRVGADPGSGRRVRWTDGPGGRTALVEGRPLSAV